MSAQEAYDDVVPLATIRLFGVDLACADLSSTADHLIGLASLDQFSYVVTTNVDHVVELSKNERFRVAYDRAAVRVVDGRPIAELTRLAGVGRTDRVTGADLLPALCERAAQYGLRVAILGGHDDVNAAAIQKLREQHPALAVSGWSPFGFEHDERKSLEIVRRLHHMRPHILFVCFGAPKSEIWLSEHASLLPPCVAVCAGAAVDFVAGTKQRAPEWVQEMGLEWLYRLVQEPNRLWRRYLVRDMSFLPLALRELILLRFRPERASSSARVELKAVPAPVPAPPEARNVVRFPRPERRHLRPLPKKYAEPKRRTGRRVAGGGERWTSSPVEGRGHTSVGWSVQS